MKKRVYFISSIVLLMFAAYFVSCDKDNEGGTPTNLTTEDAKVEIRSASQDITSNMDNFMESQAFQALDYFSFIAGDGKDWKSSIKPNVREIGQLKVAPYKELLKETFAIKSKNDPDPKVGGVYKYNYYTDDFDLIDSSVPYLRFLYPADDPDYSNQGHNAELTISDYTYVIIYDDGYEEEVPTGFKVDLKVYGSLAMNLSYSGTYDNDGIPISMSLTINMPPYSISMSQSVSGNNYTSTFSFKEGSEILMGYNLTFNMNPADEEIEKVSGYYQVSPLKVEGYMNVMDIENCTENDINCANSNMSLKLYLTTQNALIGNIEFRLFYDPYYEEEYPDLAIVYADGTHEWLADIFDADLRK